MLLCMYRDGDSAKSGVVEDSKVYTFDGDFFNPTAGTKGDLVGELNDLDLLPPIRPGKLVCVGRNYAAHAKELGNEVPTEPLIFFKPPSSVIGAGEPIQLLPEMQVVHHEAELVVVIGKRGRFITESDALDHVLGYTCANDVSERVFQKKDGQWTRAKGFDTFCPLGPVINTDLDTSNLTVSCRVNGELRQEASTSDMVFAIPGLIAYISRIMTLEPGDLILTGTPSGVSEIAAGDEVIVEVEGIGKLSNPVEVIER